MSRRSAVIGAPDQSRVDELLDSGATLLEASTATGRSQSQLWRYAQFRKGSIAAAFDNEPNPLDLMTRLLDSADAARAARRAAATAGSPSALVRAITAEAAILGRLVSELGVRDSALQDVAAEVDALLAGMRRLVTDDPDSAISLAEALAREKRLEGLSAALITAVKEKNS